MRFLTLFLSDISKNVKKVASESVVPNTSSKGGQNFALVLHLFFNDLLVIICFYCYGYPTFRGIEWPIMC